MRKHIELWEVCKTYVDRHDIHDKETAIEAVEGNEEETIELIDKIAQLVNYYYGWEEEKE